jgi:predicted acylesterase/phospholipase RssA
MSCSIPLLFPPVEYQGDHYIDGGLFMHCPLPPDENTIVLYIKNTSTLHMDTPFHMINHILVHSSNRLSPCVTIGKRFEYATDNHGLDPLLWEKMLGDEAFRAEMIQHGKDHATDLLKIEMQKTSIPS